MACPACGAGAGRALGRLAIRRCAVCGHRWLPVVDEAALLHIYESHYAGFEVPEAYRVAVREELAGTIRPRLPPPARILDVGCGGGEFLVAAGELGYEAHGLDASPAAAELCRRRGLSAEAADFLAHAPARPYDLVTFWDVLEHLPDPRAFLRRARAVLRPGGLVLVKTPGHGSLSVGLSAHIPRLAGAVLHVPAHIQFFTEATLTRMLHAEGFSSLEWPGRDGMRGPQRGGSVRKRLARLVVAGIHRAGGDRNLYCMGRVDRVAASP